MKVCEIIKGVILPLYTNVIKPLPGRGENDLKRILYLTNSCLKWYYQNQNNNHNACMGIPH